MKNCVKACNKHDVSIDTQSHGNSSCCLGKSFPWLKDKYMITLRYNGHIHGVQSEVKSTVIQFVPP